MERIIEIFGEGEELAVMQMVYRALVVFLIGLILVRIAGRRAFGIREPFDNVMTILLGAILSRAVVGASPFVATILACTAIVVLHRLFGLLAVYYSLFGKLVKGQERILYENGRLSKKNMVFGMISKRDLMKGIRTITNQDSFDNIEKIFLERDGRMSIIMKEKNSET